MTLCRDGKISLVCYVSTAIVVGLPDIFSSLELNIYPLVDYLGVADSTRFYLLHILQFLGLNFLAILSFRGFTYQVRAANAFYKSILIFFAINITSMFQFFFFFSGRSSFNLSRICLWIWSAHSHQRRTLMDHFWNLPGHPCDISLF